MTKEFTGGDITLRYKQTRQSESHTDPVIHTTCVEILSSIATGDIREYFNKCWTTFAGAGEKAFEQLTQIDEMKASLLQLIDERIALGKNITEDDVFPIAEKLHQLSVQAAKPKFQ